MYRREFIRNSSMVIGAVVVGLPTFAQAFEEESIQHHESQSPRLMGHKRFGCARALNDPAIAMSLPADFPIHFA